MPTPADGSLAVSPSPRPLALALADPPRFVATQSTYACAIEPGGDVLCWGTRQQSGTQAAPIDPPTPMSSLAGVTDLDGNGFFSCASDAAAAWCWGSALPVITGSGEPNVPRRIDLGPRSELAIGDAFVCGDSGTETRCMSWMDGSLVDAGGIAYALSPRPASIPPLADLHAIDASQAAACGIDPAGVVRCVVWYEVPRPPMPPS